MSKKQFVRLKVKKTPEVGKGMTGIVLSHPFHKPGTEVATTHVVTICGSRAETKNSIYELVLG